MDPKFEAFGKNLTLKEWAKEPECICSSYNTLYTRIYRAKWNIEQALTLPRCSSPKEKRKGVRLIEIDGVSHSVAYWSRNGSKVSKETFRHRLNMGMSPAEALVAPTFPQRQKFTAFGETKTVADWAKDSRCQVNYHALIQRLTKYQMPAEEAITLPIFTRKQILERSAVARKQNIEIKRMKKFPSEIRTHDHNAHLAANLYVLSCLTCRVDMMNEDNDDAYCRHDIIYTKPCNECRLTSIIPNCAGCYVEQAEVIQNAS